MSKPIDKMMIVSDPKLFEPRETKWDGDSFEALGELLKTNPGRERGDLVMIMVRRPLDPMKVGGREVTVAEWFFSAIWRWDGNFWSNVGFGV